MTSALVPMWILGAPLIAIIVLSAIFAAGSSAMTHERDDLRGGRVSPR